jgi:membrane-anchored protein YejM (alkaline phosphatase superfamily)
MTLWSSVVFGLIASLISLLYFKGYQLPSSALAISFVALGFLGHYIFIAFVITFPVFIINLIFPSKRALYLGLGIVYAALLALVAFDIQLFSLYKFHVNSMVWGLVSGGAAGDIFEFSLTDYLLAVLASISIVVFVWGGLHFSRRLSFSSSSFPKLTTFTVLLVMFSGQFIYAWADAAKYQPVLRQLAVIPWAMPLTAKSFFRKYDWFEVTEDVEVNLDLEGRFNYPQNSLSCHAPTKPKNLLFIIVDTLRFDTLNADVMPFTNGLTNKGFVFENHYSTGNGTRYGLFGLFYGVYSNYWKAALTEKTPSVLIDQLDKQGYEFGVFASAALTSPEFDQTIFSSVRNKIDLRTDGANKAARDLRITEKFKGFISGRNQNNSAREKPFFGMLFYDAAHGYAYPNDFDLRFLPSLKNVSYASLNNDSDPVPFFNRYRNSMAFIDQQIEQSIASLKASGEYENTVIVVTSDHGQEFNDTKQNYWGHNGNFSKWQTHVPMSIIYPDKAPQRFNHLTSHVDVVPTLMENVLGCEGDYQQYSQGWPLELEKSHPLLLMNSWTSFATFDGQTTAVFNQNGSHEIYDDNYTLKENEKLNSQDVIKAIEYNSAFLK